MIALERGAGRMLALVRQLVLAQTSAHVPAGVVAQVWRGSPRQHATRRLLHAEAVRVHALTEPIAYRIGVLLGATRTSDVTDAHVALLGRSLGAVVVTSDPDDLQIIDPELPLIVV